jgi:hypothetical protein
VYGAVTHCGSPFLNDSTSRHLCNSVKGLVPLPSAPTTPNWQRHQAVPPIRFRLIPFRSPLLRESLLLSFPRVTEMFQFTRFPLPVLCVHTGVTLHDECRVSPFGYPRIDARSTAPRGFSQSPTSFIGRRRQGIHRWLFIAWEIQRCSCSLCNSQRAGGLHAATQRGSRGRTRHDAAGRLGSVNELEGPTRVGREERSSAEALLQNGTENDDQCVNWVVPLHTSTVWSNREVLGTP